MILFITSVACILHTALSLWYFMLIKGRVASNEASKNSLNFHGLFFDQILFFPDQNTDILLPFSLLAADK